MSEAPVDGASELPGRFAMPGLVDAHCHLTLVEGERGPVAAAPELVVQRLRDLPAAGVLALRDTGAHDDTAVVLSKSGDGAVDVVACGRFLASPGNYFPGVFEGVPGERLADAGVEQLRSGAGWVKLVADFPPGAVLSEAPQANYDLDAVRALVDSVHAAGGRVAAHVTTDLVRDLVEIGIDSVEHGTALDEETLDVMAARGMAWTPTLSAVLFPPPPDAPRDRVARQRDRVALMNRLLPFAERAGVTVLAGSDVVGTVPGELAALVEHGLTPAAALAAGTVAARTFLGLTAAAGGDPADLVTYDEDPREDPSALERPAAVLRRGRRIR
jgi:imidazolonepropionase-like amidohydrolase